MQKPAIIFFGIGYDRLRVNDDVIYLTGEEMNRQHSSCIRTHHPALCPTLSSFYKQRNRLMGKMKVTSPHPPQSQVVGHVVDIQITDDYSKPPDAYGSYKAMNFIMRIYKDTLPHIFNIIIDSNNYYQLNGEEVAIYEGVKNGKIDPVQMDENAYRIVKNILFKLGQLSIGYVSSIVRVGNEDKYYAKNFIFDHISIVQTARYQKCKALFLNEKKISSCKIFYTPAIPMSDTNKPKKAEDKAVKEPQKKKVENSGPNEKEKELLDTQMKQWDTAFKRIKKFNNCEALFKDALKSEATSSFLNELSHDIILEEQEKKKKFEEVYVKEYKQIVNYMNSRLSDETKIKEENPLDLRPIKFNNNLNQFWQMLCKVSNSVDKESTKRKRTAEENEDSTDAGDEDKQDDKRRKIVNSKKLFDKKAMSAVISDMNSYLDRYEKQMNLNFYES